MTATTAAAVAALGLALVHIFTPALRFLGGTPRSIWLSAAGGVSVAYVFVHLLPELAAGQEDISRAVGDVGVYNALVGYLLLHREQPGMRSLVFFAVAMALHFLVTDVGLGEDHKERYLRCGRWALAAAVVVGLAAGTATEIPAAALAVLVAFLAGGVILNVLKEEVPSERQSRFWAFALGMSAYAALLLTF